MLSSDFHCKEEPLWIWRWTSGFHKLIMNDSKMKWDRRMRSEMGLENLGVEIIRLLVQWLPKNYQKVILTLSDIRTQDLSYSILYLFWWRGHCCPMDCDLFQIYCAPPNLAITRTWICRLNVAQRPIFSGLNLRLGTHGLMSLPEDLSSGFLHPEKIHRPQSGLNPRTLDLEASKLPQDHRGRLLE